MLTESEIRKFINNDEASMKKHLARQGVHHLRYSQVTLKHYKVEVIR